MQFSNGNKNEYLYDASGVKHKATYNYAVNPMQIPLGATTTENVGTNLSQSSYTDYCGNYVYENGKIKRILTPEGYIEAAGAIPMDYIPYRRYNYMLKDHLGNTRMRLYGDYISARSPILNNYAAIGVIDYYPFGMEIESFNMLQEYPTGNLFGMVTPYLYNGKEMDRINGLNEYDYGARWRDPILGNGWNTVDPLCEKYYSISPYAYCANNPVNNIDANGDSITVTQEAIETIYAGLKEGEKLHMTVNNGMIDPESIKDQAENSDDLFLQDLFEIASAEQVVEMSVGPSYEYKDNNGKTLDSNKDYHATPADQPETSPPPFRSIYDDRENDGTWSVSGNLGRTLVPGYNNPTGANSTNNNHIQVIINSNGTVRQRAVGAAHEFGHVVLYLRSGGKNYKHGQNGVQSEIDKRTNQMIKKLYK